jgi:hypothetical protein
VRADFAEGDNDTGILHARGSPFAPIAEKSSNRGDGMVSFSNARQGFEPN